MSYDAFLSYSHSADDRLAPTLQSSLQKFAKPWHRLKAINVFRDKTSLAANPGLWTSICDALDLTKYFVLLASPESAQSIWVQKEISHWLEKNPIDRLLIVLTDGELKWDVDKNDFDWNITDALPHVLKGRLNEEPLHVDLRWARSEETLSLQNGKFRDQIADLAAAIRGVSKDQIAGEEVRQHKRTKRTIAAVMAAMLMLTIGTGLGAYIGVKGQLNAEKSRGEALAAADVLVLGIAGDLKDLKGVPTPKIASILHKAEGILEKITSYGADGVEWRQANSMNRLAELYLDIGEIEQAEQRIARSQAAAVKAMTFSSSETLLLIIMASNHRLLARIGIQKSDYSTVGQNLQESLETVGRLDTSSENGAVAAAEGSIKSYLLLALAAQRQGLMDQADAHSETALKIANETLARFPANSDVQSVAALASKNFALLNNRSQADPERRLAANKLSLQLIEKIAAGKKDGPTVPYEVAKLKSIIADQEGRLKDAIEAAITTVHEAEELTKQDPDNLIRVEFLVGAHERLAYFLEKDTQAQAALAARRKVIDLAGASLKKSGVTDSHLPGVIALAHLNIGKTDGLSHAEKMAHIDAGITLLDGLEGPIREDLYLQLRLTTLLRQKSVLALLEKKFADVAAPAGRAWKIGKSLVMRGYVEKDVDLAGLIDNLIILGTAYRSVDDYEHAADAYETALAALHEHWAMKPDDVKRQKRVFDHIQEMAKYSLESDRRPDAIKFYGKGIELAREMSKNGGNRQELEYTASTLLERTGDQHSSIEAFPQASESYRQCADTRSSPIFEALKNPQIDFGIVRCLLGLASSQDKTGSPPDANATRNRAIGILNDLLRKYPDHPHTEKWALMLSNLAR